MKKKLKYLCTAVWRGLFGSYCFFGFLVYGDQRFDSVLSINPNPDIHAAIHIASIDNSMSISPSTPINELHVCCDPSFGRFMPARETMFTSDVVGLLAGGFYLVEDQRAKGINVGKPSFDDLSEYTESNAAGESHESSCGCAIHLIGFFGGLVAGLWTVLNWWRAQNLGRWLRKTFFPNAEVDHGDSR
jgi:hypothetical protein